MGRQEIPYEGSEPYVISGERNLLAVADLSHDMGRLRQLFELFEQKTGLLRIFDLSRAARACRSSSAGNWVSRRRRT